MEVLLSIIFVSHQFFGGNLDTFYLFSVIMILIEIFRFKYKNIMDTIMIFTPFFIIYLIQVLLLDNFNYYKGIFFIGKVFICLYLLVFIKNRSRKLNIQKFTYYSTILLTILFIISLIIKTEQFWMLNDVINKYSTLRLKLIYIEPSELGFHVALLIILLLFNKKSINQNLSDKKYLINLLILLILLFLPKGLGAISILIFTIIIIIIFDYFSNKLTKRKLFLIYFGILSFPIIILISSYMFEDIYLRIISILNGADSSFNYRYFAGLRAISASFENNALLGIGFGNLNTDYYKYIFYDYGIINKVANSFMYLMIEGGIITFGYLMILHIYLARGIKHKDYRKYALLIFIFIYQIAGGYITNPVNYFIYGLIASKNMIKGEKNEC
jgi:hypothetical protein